MFCSKKVLFLLVIVSCKFLEQSYGYSIGSCERVEPRNGILCFDSYNNPVNCNGFNFGIGSKLRCKPFYSSRNGFSESVCNSNGIWSFPDFQCKTDCGNTEHKDNSQNPRPFLATIYQMVKKNLNLPICRGTLISENHVITSAFCILNHKDKVVEIEDISVGFPGLNSSKYKVKFLNYSSEDTCKAANETDLAIFTLEKEVDFSERVLPICLPSCGQIEEIALKNGSHGEVILPNGKPEKFEVHFYPECETLGVFCAKGKELGVQETGTPLTVPMINSVYFLEGVLSPTINTIKNNVEIQHCEDSKSFTRIFPHMKWIKSIIQEEIKFDTENLDEIFTTGTTTATPIPLESFNSHLEHEMTSEKQGNVPKSRRRDLFRNTGIEVKLNPTNQPGSIEEAVQRTQIEIYNPTTEQPLLRTTLNPSFPYSNDDAPSAITEDEACDDYNKEFNPDKLENNFSVISITNSKIDTEILLTTLLNHHEEVESIIIEHSCLTSGLDRNISLPNLKSFRIRDTKLHTTNTNIAEYYNYMPMPLVPSDIAKQRLNIFLNYESYDFVISFQHEVISIHGWQDAFDKFLEGTEISSSINWKSMQFGNIILRSDIVKSDHFPSSLTSLYLTNIQASPADMKTVFTKNSKLDIVYLDVGSLGQLNLSVFNNTHIRGIKIETGDFITDYEEEVGWFGKITKTPLTFAFQRLTHLHLGQNVSFDSDIIENFDKYFTAVENVAYLGEKDNFELFSKTLQLKSLKYFMIKMQNSSSTEAIKLFEKYKIQTSTENNNRNPTYILFSKPFNTTDNLVGKILNATEIVDETAKNFFAAISASEIIESAPEL